MHESVQIFDQLTLSLLQANGPQPPIFLKNDQGSKMAVILNQNMHAQ